VSYDRVHIFEALRPGRWAVCAIGIGLLAGCQGGGVNAPAPPTGETVSLSGDIQPIFNSACVSCHADGTISSAFGNPLRLTSGRAHANLVDRRSFQSANWTLVVPGDSSASLLWLKVSRADPPVGSTMPLFGSPLSSRQLGLIRDWIDQGALDN